MWVLRYCSLSMIGPLSEQPQEKLSFLGRVKCWWHNYISSSIQGKPVKHTSPVSEDNSGGLFMDRMASKLSILFHLKLMGYTLLLLSLSLLCSTSYNNNYLKHGNPITQHYYKRVHNFGTSCRGNHSSKPYSWALSHLHNMEANGEVFPHTSLLRLLSTSATGSPQPLLVPHILLVEAHHYLSLISRNNECILQNGQRISCKC